MLVIQQPDGTLAQVPAWMFEPTAATFPIGGCVRLPLGTLRELRLTLDEVLSSVLDSNAGGPNAAHDDTTWAARSSDAAGAGSVPAGGDAATAGGLAGHFASGGGDGSGGERR
jgi:hypothetical protein